jgi:hypothetical protein
MLAGWTHYIAFDLLAAVWICQDATKRAVPYFLILPCLPLTMMAGPCGLVIYMILRLPFGTKTASVDKDKKS